MSNAPESARRARDVALRRLRRATQVAVAVSIAVGAGFAALAAGSTHAKKAVHVSTRRVTAKRAAPLASAPAPPLVAVQGADQAAPPAAPSPAPPASAPTQSYAPPVVVSGGS